MSEAKHTAGAYRVADILLCHRARVGTEYGIKDRDGLADMIDRETGLVNLLAAMEAAVERMECVAEHIPVENRPHGVSQATHVRHLAGHLAVHARFAREALAAAGGGA